MHLGSSLARPQSTPSTDLWWVPPRDSSRGIRCSCHGPSSRGSAKDGVDSRFDPNAWSGRGVQEVPTSPPANGRLCSASLTQSRNKVCTIRGLCQLPPAADMPLELVAAFSLICGRKQSENECKNNYRSRRRTLQGLLKPIHANGGILNIFRSI